MAQYRSLIEMQPNEGPMQTFDSGEHADIMDCMDAQCKLIAAHFQQSEEWAGDFLADMEIHGKINERFFRDGVELSGDELMAYL
jgi:hemerythrin